MPAATQWAFDSMTIAKRTRPPCLPSQRSQLLLEGVKRLVEAQGVVRIARRPAAHFLGVDLPDAELGAAARCEAATSSGVVVVTEWLSEQVVPVASISMPAT